MHGSFALATLALLAAPLLAQEDPLDVTRNFETVKVAEGIYAFIAPEPRSGVVNGNSTVIIGERGVVVVDSGQFPTLARRQIAEIRKLTDQPVRAVVNTHWHWDHNLGNAVYREAFPGVDIISTPFTREFIATFTPGFLAHMTGNGEAMVERFRAMLASGQGADGTPLTEAELDELRHLARDFGYGLPELKQVTLDPPDVTFDREMTIHLGAREVRILFPGRANTAGDAYVWVPDAKVLVTGDIVVYPTPYATSAYPADWVGVLGAMKQLAPAAIVPGHGPVQRDMTYIDLVARALQSVVDQAGAAAREGLTLEQAQERIDLEPVRRQFAGDDPLRRKAFDDYFAASAIANAYRQAKGEATDEAPFPRPPA